MVGVSKRAEKELNKESEDDAADMKSRLRPTVVNMKKTRLNDPRKAPGKGITRSTAQVKEVLKVFQPNDTRARKLDNLKAQHDLIFL
jgi:hypothetical protein